MSIDPRVKLPIMESFYTLQGEGYHQGKAAHFIRIAGCDVGCHWCDVKESWDRNQHNEIEIGDLLKDAQQSECKFIVITGGEPVMYNLEALTGQFVENGYYLALETSGAYSLSGSWHWICLSPKKNKAPLEEYYERAHELKVVVYNRDDIRWAEEHAKKVNKNCKLYLQAEWSKRDKISPILIDYIKKNPQWSLSMQSHKYLDIP